MISNLRNGSFVKVSLIAVFCLVLGERARAGVGESAVITLIFPPGARATGLGEAFTGLSDDASATFYNPAGLGQAPQANSWKLHLYGKNYDFTAIAAKKKKEFGIKDKIWAGTNKGVLRFDGKSWSSDEIYLIEQDDNLTSIVNKYLKVDDENLLKDAAWAIRIENSIGMKKYAALSQTIKNALLKQNAKSIDSTSKALARQILEMPSFERSVQNIKNLIMTAVDTSRADTLANMLDNVFLTEDTDLEDLQELKIPFSIAIKDTVSAIIIDASDRVWIGTHHGLWRYSGTEWNLFTVLDGLPSDNITCLTAGTYGEIAAGTDKGAALYNSGKWTIHDSSSGLPSEQIDAITFGQGQTLFLGTPKGLVKVKDSTVTVFDTSSGLLSLQVYALLMDSQKRLWIGGDNGVSVFDETTWKRYKFPDSRVSTFTEQNSGVVWIGTNKGAISYKDGRTKVDKNGTTVQMPPEWKTFHSKNALKGNNIRGLSVHGNDIWIATDEAINQYDIAEKQAFLAFEPLLPSLHLRELWHLYGAFIYPTQDWGTLGLSINYINMGTNEITNALGRQITKVHSWEGVFGLSYGLPLKEDLSLGMNIKYVVSALAPGVGSDGEGVGQTFAIDAAVLKRGFLLRNFDLGFMAQNMGPHIFYIDRENLDPIPFTLRLGMVYHAVQTPIHDLKILFDMNKEVVKNNFSGDPDPFWKALITDLIFDKDETLLYEFQEINYNLGLEYWYTNFLALRTGFLGDYIGERYELTLGVGVRYGTINFDWSYIVAPEGFLKGVLKSINPEKNGATGVRDGQWRAAFLVNF